MAAAAQSPSPPPLLKDPSLFGFEHEVHAVPASPADYPGIDERGRIRWFVRSTVGGPSLLGGAFAAGLGTATDSPREYGPHWEGFGKRNAMRLTGISTGNAIEITFGAAIHEDPRYFHTVDRPVGSRVKNVVDLTFRAYYPDGERHLAYGRYASILGNNFLSNTWRAPSESDWQHALLRSAEGFGGRALSNVFSEFSPAIWRKIRHKECQ
jgi:hypothetical protein